MPPREAGPGDKDEQVTLAGAIRELAATLRNAGMDEPRSEARRLVSQVLDIDPVRLIARDDDSLSASQMTILNAAGERRAAGEPLSRIVGYREFYGRRFTLSPATLDPRPDTETLVESVLEALESTGPLDRPLRILDVGTGSGCLAITLLAELPGATALATDISADAIETARINAANIGVAGRISFERRDILTGIAGPFDVLVSNPPYIASSEIAGLDAAVRCYDPKASLDGGPDGLNFYRQLISGASSLVPAGLIAFEVGAAQADAVAALSEGHGLGPPGFVLDLNGHTRCVLFKTLVS